MRIFKKKLLFYDECMGLYKPDRFLHVTAGEINPTTGKAYAVNPSSGNWDDNYFAQNFGNNPANNFGNAGSSASPEQLAQQQRDIFLKAIQPSVTSLESSRPEVNTAYDTRQAQVEASRTPLMERYQKLIDDIRGAGAGQVTDTTRVASQEFGKRGITGTSTFAQEEMLRRTQPIQQATESNVTNTTLDREEKLRGLDDLITNLTQEKVAAQRDITNTIAQIQASAGTQAAQAAIQMYQLQEQARQAALDRAIAEKNAETARITATTPGTQIVTANGRQLLIDSQTGATIRDIGPSGTGSGDGGITFNTTPANTLSSTAKSTNATSSFKADVKDQFGNTLSDLTKIGINPATVDPLSKSLSGIRIPSVPTIGSGLNLAGQSTYFR